MHFKKLLLLPLLFLVIFSSTKGQTFLVEDYNLGESGCVPFPFDGIKFGNKYIFSISNDEHGAELAKLEDGKITLLADIYPGAESSNPNHFVILNGLVYFAAITPEEEGTIWRTDGTISGTELFFDPVANFDTQPNGLIVSKSNDLYFTHSDNFYHSDGIITTLLGTDIRLFEESIQVSNNHGHFQGGIVFPGQDDNPTTLYMASGNELTELATYDGGFNSKNFGFSELENGFVFSNTASGAVSLNQTFIYNATSQSLSILEDNYMDRLHPIEGNKALGYDRDYGFYVFSDATQDPLFVYEDENFSIVNRETMSRASFSDKVAFTDVNKIDIFYVDLADGQATQLLDDSRFGSEFIVHEKHAFISFPFNANGNTHNIYYLDLETGDLTEIHSFDTSFSELDPIVILDGHLYFFSNKDETVGQELYSLPLGFTVSTKNHDSKESFSIENHANQYVIRSDKDVGFAARVFNLNGQLLQTFSGRTNIYYEAPSFSSIYILEVILDRQHKAAKIMGW